MANNQESRFLQPDNVVLAFTSSVSWGHDNKPNLGPLVAVFIKTLQLFQFVELPWIGFWYGGLHYYYLNFFFAFYFINQLHLCGFQEECVLQKYHLVSLVYFNSIHIKQMYTVDRNSKRRIPGDLLICICLFLYIKFQNLYNFHKFES